MALFASSDNPQVNNEEINKNQYLTKNPNTASDANTSWMGQSSDSSPSGSNRNIAQSQPNPPSQVSNGTVLGSIASGSMPNFISAPTQDQLRAYGQSRGVNLNDSTLNYWNPQKWEELKQRGRELQPGTDGSWYANKFLSNEEQFTGGAHQTAMNMWGFDPAEQGNANASNPLMALLQQLLGGANQKQYAQPYDPHAGNKSSGIGINPNGMYTGGGVVPKVMDNGGSLIGYNGNTGITGGLPTGNGSGVSMLGYDPGAMSFLGGGVIDPITGVRRNPRPGEPQ